MSRTRALIAALCITAAAPLAVAQPTDSTPAQKKPAKPGAQAGPAASEPMSAASAAAAAASTPVADKQPAKPGAQGGPEAASAPR